MKYYKINGFKLILLLILVLCISIITILCFNTNNKNTNKKYIRKSELNFIEDKYNENIYFDSSQIDQGYFYFTLSKDLQAYLLKGNKVVSNWPKVKEKTLIKGALLDGIGKYTLKIINKNNKEVFSKKLYMNNDISIIMSTTMVNFNKYSKYIKDSNKIFKQSKNNQEFIKNITKFVNKKVSYSTKDLIKNNYIPNLDLIYERKYGICVDFASIECAILRSQQISSILVYGYYKNEYHAWIEAFIDNKWIIIDPTNNKILKSNNNKDYVKKYIF